MSLLGGGAALALLGAVAVALWLSRRPGRRPQRPTRPIPDLQDHHPEDVQERGSAGLDADIMAEEVRKASRLVSPRRTP